MVITRKSEQEQPSFRETYQLENGASLSIVCGYGDLGINVSVYGHSVRGSRQDPKHELLLFKPIDTELMIDVVTSAVTLVCASNVKELREYYGDLVDTVRHDISNWVASH